jgi:lantibiotic biosynthesis protein
MRQRAPASGRYTPTVLPSPQLPSVSQAREPFQPAGFFVIRTPLLPGDTLHWLFPDTGLPAGVDAERTCAEAAVTRDRLRALVSRPEVREALHIASPSLSGSMNLWLERPASEQGRKVERALLRYVARMSFRPTPFGLFSGYSIGSFGTASALELPPLELYRRHTMLDLGLVEEALGPLRDRPEVRAQLRYRPNPTGHRCGPHVRYTETHRRHGRLRHDGVMVDWTPHLQCLLERAQRGATPDELARALAAFDPELALEDARGFVTEAIDGQLLVDELAVPITGADPVAEAVTPLVATPEAGAVVSALERGRLAAAALDHAPPGGNDLAAYERLRQLLAETGSPPSDGQMINVVLRKPAPGMTLPPHVVEEVLRAEPLLRSFAPAPDAWLTSFITRFRERYQDQEVPLLEALDDEIGVGFLPAELGALTPLLEGITVPGAPLGEVRGADPRDSYLLDRLGEVLADGRDELVLGDDDVAALVRPDAPPLPDSWCLMAVLAARSAADVDRGDYRLLLRPVFGASGVRLFSRFCHGDPELRAKVRAMSDAEDELSDAVRAELVYLPQARAGNVLAHPSVRRFEIPVNGRPTVPHERRIPLADLRVSVSDQRIHLRSQRLGREVIPSVSSAFQHRRPGMSAVYQFLARLGGQGVTTSGVWSWGALEGGPRLPRVRHGRLILDVTRWRLSRRHLAMFAAADWPAAVRELRRRWRLPRWIGLQEGDHVLPFNLDNAVSAESFARAVRGIPEAQLVEIWPRPDELCLTDGRGRFHSELLVPFIRRARAAASEPRAAAAAPAHPAAPGRLPARRLAPGSECLFLCVYGGYASLDGWLAEVLPGLLAALPSGVPERWFFIRYGDPEWHLRLRFFGPPQALYATLLPLLHRALLAAQADRRVHRYRLDTYEREVERYGGPQGIELSEGFFHRDSEFTLRLLAAYRGAGMLRVRGQLAFASVDRLLGLLGLSPGERERQLQAWHEHLARGAATGPALSRELGRHYRLWRRAIESAVTGPATPELAAGLAILDERDARLGPLAAEIDRGWRTGLLTGDRDRYHWSLCHMHLTRLLVAMPRQQEMVLYDGLRRLHVSRRARTAGSAGSARPPEPEQVA